MHLYKKRFSPVRMEKLLSKRNRNVGEAERYFYRDSQKVFSGNCLIYYAQKWCINGLKWLIMQEIKLLWMLLLHMANVMYLEKWT
jgi:hypothetical protein